LYVISCHSEHIRFAQRKFCEESTPVGALVSRSAQRFPSARTHLCLRIPTLPVGTGGAGRMLKL
jgi:hypothetical protein